MFLSPGEKLLKYRKKYGITQEELARGKVSKTFISMIEKNKKPLNKKIGKLIYENLTDILFLKKIKIELNFENFLMGVDEQIKLFFKEIREKEDEFLKLDQFTLEDIILKLKKDAQIKKIKQVIEIYKKNNRTEDCKVWYTKFFQRIIFIKGYEDEFLEFLNLGLKLKDYKVIYIFLNKYMDEIKILKDSRQIDEIKHIYFLILLNLNKEIGILENIKNIVIKDKKINVKLFKILGKAHVKLGQYDEAIKMYNLFYKKVNNISEKIEIIINQIELYIKKKEINEIKNSYFKLKKIQEKIIHKSEKNRFELLYELGRTAEILERKNESKNYYIEALIVGKGVEVPIEKVMLIILSLFKNFEKNDYYSFLSIEKEYFRILEKYKDYRAALKLIEYYYKNHPKRLDEKFSIINNYLE